ncbi:MAG: DEAD/DEAH box helicase [Gemmataceae bacterium]
MPPHDPLSLFLPLVAHWFRSALGEPTEVQRQGWPVIAAGKNTLLLAPTGSGKTLAAFLACLDALWREPELKPGVRILYISPLKALNNDIHRNLQAPLEGVAQSAATLGVSIPRIETAVRTGDTPMAERQRLSRKPPQILITTPESLNLLLTSKARDTLTGVTHCIVDEIHALCPNKRGVFLALLLERLEALAAKPFVRIGLSATQRPLEEVARYLGGAVWNDGALTPRPVTIVDAGLRKHLDLKIESPVEAFGPLPEQTIWPSIDRLLAREIRQHRSTIVFANNRRAAERLTARLNEILSLGAEGEEGAPADAEPIQVRAHHGSVSLEMRQQTEQALKEGRLRAVVATASLELGIDMGAVELVCQVESPGNVARGLQRVGRAGHLVGQQSKGRLIPKTLPDLVNEAVLAREMMAGRVEKMRVPRNCLDILAQQVVAMTAMDVWKVDELYRRLRQAYPYADLTPAAFDAVLEMVSGRYRLAAPPSSDEKPSDPKVQMRAMQPRISWDRVHQKLHALPGSQKLALAHGGTIPDMGHYAVVTRGGNRIGELDEEFVYERRVGDAFLSGTSSSRRIDRIDVDRVVVYPAEGAPAMAPFWHGEQTGRTFDLGLAQGQFLREMQDRLGHPDCMERCKREFYLDRSAARNLREFAQRHFLRTGALPTDRCFQVEASRDPLGDWQVLLLTPLGARFHLTLRFAFEALLRKRLGYRPQCLHHDDGVLVRLTESDEPILDVFEGMTPENLESLVLEELADSALFALRFRQNAARALLMPKTGTGQRAPLWLQRLRGRDLLQTARQFPDFPILAETFRECLEDHSPRVRGVLEQMKAGTSS